MFPKIEKSHHTVLKPRKSQSKPLMGVALDSVLVNGSITNYIILINENVLDQALTALARRVNTQRLTLRRNCNNQLKAPPSVGHAFRPQCCIKIEHNSFNIILKMNRHWWDRKIQSKTYHFYTITAKCSCRGMYEILILRFFYDLTYLKLVPSGTCRPHNVRLYHSISHSKKTGNVHYITRLA